MKVVFGSLPRPLFGQDQEPLFRTRRISVFPDQTQASETNSIGWQQLVQIMHAVFKVFQTGKQDGAEATGVPSDAAAGLKIQLGGREDYSPQKLKEEKLGLLATLKTSFKEGVAVFWGKIKWIVSRPPQGENGSRFDNLKVVFNGLFPGSPLSSNK